MTQGTRETLLWFNGLGCGIICGDVYPIFTIFGIIIAVSCAIALQGRTVQKESEG